MPRHQTSNDAEEEGTAFMLRRPPWEPNLCRMTKTTHDVLSP